MSVIKKDEIINLLKELESHRHLPCISCGCMKTFSDYLERKGVEVRDSNNYLDQISSLSVSSNPLLGPNQVMIEHKDSFHILNMNTDKYSVFEKSVLMSNF